LARSSARPGYLAVAAGGGERDHRPDVRHALAETLEGRAGEMLAALGDDVMAAVVELEVSGPAALSRLDSSWISACPEEKHRPEAVHPDERGAAAALGSATTPSSPHAVRACEGGRATHRRGPASS